MAVVLFVLLSFSLGVLGRAAPNACDGKKLPRFEEYPAATTYKGRAHLPILATPLDHKYRTTIRIAAAKGVNFSGHFAIVTWGCGTGCKGFVIVDLKTGTVYDPPFDEIGFHYGPREYDPGWQCYSDLLTYRRDSSLLMEHGRLRQVAFDPDRLRDGTVAPF